LRLREWASQDNKSLVFETQPGAAGAVSACLIRFGATGVYAGGHSTVIDPVLNDVARDIAVELFFDYYRGRLQGDPCRQVEDAIQQDPECRLLARRVRAVVQWQNSSSP